MSSSSSFTIPSKTRYDVFLSFRGVDTRLNFASHLYAALRRKHITTFKDDTSLDRGDEISPTLLKAIEESKMSVIIFSENYASSQWCLDELVKIMECMKSMGRKVLPIFYHVDPSNVRNQTGNFGVEFGKVKERFKEKVDRIEKWITALREAANLSGWDSNNCRLESELSEGVANKILKNLYPAYFSACSNFSGIEAHIYTLLSLLRIGATDVRLIGIWGMGGIGKTTITEVLLSRISDQFDDYCFLSNVREKSEKDELVQLRKCLFSKLLGDESLSIEMFHVLPTFVLDMLSRKKVFVVLDDVNDSDQLEALAGNHDWFGPGSRVIVTSRDKEVLNNGVDMIYSVNGLEYNDALQLLSMKAFKQKHPPKDFIELSERVVNYANGVPLALKVLGSHLCKRSRMEWESALNKLKQFPHSKIQKILEISYDTLEQSEKDIFLDIACFFKGSYKIWAEEILNGCGLAASMGINRLQDKCLIVIYKNNLEMHDLIQEMGLNIARRSGSRLWNPLNICDMLITDMMKESVEGVFLDLSQVGKVQLNHATFSRMLNLRLLAFFRPQYCSKNKNTGFIIESTQSNNLPYLSNKLSLLHWDEYPYKTMPSNFFMQNLIQLVLRESQIEQIWTEDKFPWQLKYLDLFGSTQLTRLPNLSLATNLELINLGQCQSLLEIPSSIQSLHRLRKLCLYRCEKLRTLPSLIQLKSLTHLRLSHCSNLKIVLEIPENIQVLYLEWSGLEEWSPKVRVLNDLQCLSMWQCKNLRSLPSSMSLNYGIKKLDLTGCLNLNKFPVIIGNLEVLVLNQTGIEELPSSIRHLSSLVELEMKECERLQSLSSSICKLELLERLVLSGCSKLEKLPPLYGLSSLKELHLDRSGLNEISTDIVSLTSLTVLNINYCHRLQCLPELPTRLMELQAVNCWSLETTKPPSSYAFTGSFNVGQFGKYKYLFNYCNCINLDNNARCNTMEGVRLRIEEIAIASALPLCFKQNDPVVLCGRENLKWEIVVGFPGSEIPEWDSEFKREVFSIKLIKDAFGSEILEGYSSVGLPREILERNKGGLPSKIPEWFGCRSQGSSISMQFPPCCRDVMGFAFCAVLEFHVPLCLLDYFFIVCECHFKSDNGNRQVQFRSSTIRLEAILQSDHLFLWYNNFDTSSDLRDWLIQNDVNKALFEFEVEHKIFTGDEASEFDKVKLSVKGCGLQMLYAKGWQKRWNCSRRQTKLSVECGANKRKDYFCSNQTDIIAHGIFGYKEEERHPKRLRQAIVPWA